ncbi:hypothetical protein RhiirA4_479454 [Rhizophagus irregularis]|uniref:Uncharacterized protein n=1 Tax=Rhizophagus irregularis TaxID=588596 RepID=A0A2I1HGG6_9GLOM|nr:hypothetical protein RhiirA4_479454 [Rhizophagus irregularis]
MNFLEVTSYLKNILCLIKKCWARCFTLSKLNIINIIIIINIINTSSSSIKDSNKPIGFVSSDDESTSNKSTKIVSFDDENDEGH